MKAKHHHCKAAHVRKTESVAKLQVITTTQQAGDPQ